VSRPLDPTTASRLDAVLTEGWALWERFDLEVRTERFHPFVAADYDAVRAALEHHCTPGQRFLEWGSATGVITIMADVLGCDAVGIELDESLVRTARGLAERMQSRARFAPGSFVPGSYRPRPGITRTRSQWTGQGESAYPMLGRALDDFDIVFGFPWGDEAPMMLDIMKQYGSGDALLMLYSIDDGVQLFRDGRRWPRPR
jgi:hypothetical protein